jgi:carbamoyltransferase
MITLGIHHGPHDGSIALLKNDKVLFHLQGERLSNIKHDYSSVQVLNYIKKYTKHIDNVVVTGAYRYYEMEQGTPAHTPEMYLFYLKRLTKEFNESKINYYEFFDNHHQIHAFTSFYNSGFDQALGIVIDGMGSVLPVNYSDRIDYLYGLDARETKSAFIMSYPNITELVECQASSPKSSQLPDGKNWLNEKIYATKSFSEAMAYQGTAINFGFTEFDAGKVMGMAPYGIPGAYKKDIIKDGLVDQELFSTGSGGIGSVEYVGDPIGELFQDRANFAHKLQKDVEESVLNYTISLIEKTKQKNVCFSGGFFLNCVSNYNLLKKLPKDIKIYVEPLCSDVGNSIGAAKYIYYSLTKNKEKAVENTLYYGPKYEYTKHDLKEEKLIENVTAEHVAKLISEKNIVAIYQGGSESGPRALGNRSILYDPRDPDGKDHVNKVKRREWFRPFAGSILKENAKDWFDLQGMEESKSMMYAVDVIENKKEIIPAITHVDGTCRVQTVSKEDNPNFYKLIDEFFKITGVPILFNTSFNLGGNAIVETLDDALWTIHNSDIEYLYLPDLEALVIK